jgi:hypothetical protein
MKRFLRRELVLAAASLAFPGTAWTAELAPRHPSTEAPVTERLTAERCQQRYDALKREVETKAEPIREASHQTVPRDAFCRALTDYEEAELKMIGFVEAESKRCGFSPEISEKMKRTYLTTTKLKERACDKTRLRLS